MLHGILVNPAPVKAFRGGGEGYLSTQVFTGTKPAQTRPSSSSQKFLPANLHSRKLHHFPGANLILNWSLG
jgi:hypothetical protein